jgi:hypothetical protein
MLLFWQTGGGTPGVTVKFTDAVKAYLGPLKETFPELPTVAVAVPGAAP